MYLWNTTEGGPCFLRPTGSKSADSPSPKTSSNRCLGSIDADWKAQVDTKRGGCKKASFTDQNVQIGASNARPRGTVVGPYSEVDPNDNKERQNRHSTGWSNTFAFPWEISSFWDFTTSTEKGQRAIGCPGHD
eukprot:UN00001